LGVSAIKDSSGDSNRLAQEILSIGFETYTGAPPLLGVANQFGGAGSITGVANVRPEWSAQAWAGDQKALVDVTKLGIQTSQSFPTELKRAVAARWSVPLFSRVGTLTG
jgi:dihydrodipicolinate synthase/N-acetylneuraminate lyase